MYLHDLTIFTPTAVLDDTFTHFGGFFPILCIFNIFDIRNYIEITQSVMPKPDYLLTVQEAHKKHNSLMNQIWAKYEQLDSGEYGTVGTPAFNAEACELANLLACVSLLC